MSRGREVLACRPSQVEVYSVAGTSEPMLCLKNIRIGHVKDFEQIVLGTPVKVAPQECYVVIMSCLATYT